MDTLMIPGAVFCVTGIALKMADLPNEIAGLIAVVFAFVCITVQSYFEGQKKKASKFAVEDYSDISDEEPEETPKEKPAKKKSKKKSRNARKKAAKEAERQRRRDAGEESEEVDELVPEPVKFKKTAKQRKRERQAAKKAEEARLAALEEAQLAEEAKKGKKKKKKNKKNKKNKAEPQNDDAVEAKKNDESDWNVQGRHGRVLAVGEVDRSLAKRQAKEEAAAAAAAEAEANKGPKLDLLEVKIDPKYYGNIIGKGGSRLDMLCQGTGAQIEMPKKDTGSHVVQIRGSREQIADAKAALTSLVQNGYCAYTDPGTTSMDMKVDRRGIRLIIGDGGKNIRALQDATDVRINTPDRGSNGDKVTIVGSIEGVMMCKHSIETLLLKGFSQVTHPNWSSVNLMFPAELRPSLIGKRGETIQALESTYDVNINVPETRGVREIQLTVAGTSAGIDAACKEIRQLTIVEEVPMDAAWGGTAAGFNLNDLNSWDLP